MNIWLIVGAAAAMFGQDIIGTLMVQAQARNRAELAGLMDTAGWLLTITTTTISVTALQGHSLTAKIAVIAAVSSSNFFGTYTGVRLGKRYIKDSVC